MKKYMWIALFCLMSTCLIVPDGQAVYYGMNYQGHVNVTDVPFTGDGQFMFALIKGSSSAYLWSNDGNYPPTTGVPVSVDNGLFDVILGDPPMESLIMSSIPDDILLRIWFDDGTSGFQLLAPDQQITSTIFALKAFDAVNADWAYQASTCSTATDADTVDGQHASEFAAGSHEHWGETWSGTGTGLILEASTTGLSGSGDSYGVQGTTTTGSGVYGYADATTGTTYGIRGESDSTSGRGVYGYATASTGTNNGVYGETDSISGRGLYGWATASSGTNYGMYGRSDSSDGRGANCWATAGTGTTYGVYGQSDSTSGRGVFGVSSATTGTVYGVSGACYSISGRGVYGNANATTGTTYGVYGRSLSTSGRGVYGYTSTTSGFTYGVEGESASINGRGVFGSATSTSGTTYGVRGESLSTSGRGIYGKNSATTGYTYGVIGESNSTSGRGVYGNATASTGTTYGVWGENNSTDGRGVYGEATASTGDTHGVYAYNASASGKGVYAWADSNTGTNYGVFGRCDSNDGSGVLGHNYFSGAGVSAYSYDGNLIEAYDGDPPGGVLRFYINQTGTAYADGGHSTFKQTGLTKEGDRECRTLTAISSPGSWFEDFGSADLVGTEIKVDIEPVFASVVNLDVAYHVYLTPVGGYCPLYVAEKTPHYFVVRSGDEGCDLSFDYRIVAKRLGDEHKRLETIVIPVPEEQERPLRNRVTGE